MHLLQLLPVPEHSPILANKIVQWGDRGIEISLSPHIQIPWSPDTLIS